LTLLDTAGVNAFTLFSSEDSLLETMAMRALLF